MPAAALLARRPVPRRRRSRCRLAPGADQRGWSAGLDGARRARRPSATAATARGVPLVDVLRTILRAVAIVDGLVCLYALIQACALTVQERRRTIAVVRACGPAAPAVAAAAARRGARAGRPGRARRGAARAARVRSGAVAAGRRATRRCRSTPPARRCWRRSRAWRSRRRRGGRVGGAAGGARIGGRAGSANDHAAREALHRRAAARLAGAAAVAGGLRRRRSGSRPRPGRRCDSTWIDPVGDGQLRVGPGEALLDRLELGREAGSRRVLATIAHVTDAHVLDASSPARVTFLDRLGPPFQSTFRPQEALTAQVLAGDARGDPRAAPAARDPGRRPDRQRLRPTSSSSALAVLRRRAGRARAAAATATTASSSRLEPGPVLLPPRRRRPAAPRAAARRGPAVPRARRRRALVPGARRPRRARRGRARPDAAHPVAGGRRPRAVGPAGRADAAARARAQTALAPRRTAGAGARRPAACNGRSPGPTVTGARRPGAPGAVRRRGGRRACVAAPPAGCRWRRRRLDYALDVGPGCAVIVLDLVRRDGGSGGLVVPGQAGLARSAAGSRPRATAG